MTMWKGLWRDVGMEMGDQKNKNNIKEGADWEEWVADKCAVSCVLNYYKLT